MKVAAAKESVMKERLDSSDDVVVEVSNSTEGHLLHDLSLRNSDDISLKDIFSLKDVCCVNAEQILLNNKHTIITAAMKSDSILITVYINH